jgi:hypothetical protein
MILAWLLLLTGLTISSVAIYYSVVGLTAIFSAAAIPIMIMGVSLEVAKLVCATWIKQYWTQVPRLMKTYMVTAIVLLMIITSMGIFGFLSKAHNDQTLVSGDVGSKIAIYDEKIRTARDNIDAGRKQLQQMDAAVDQVMGRSTDEKGADKAVAIRNGQKRDRAAIAKDIEANQRIIATLNDEAAPIRAEVRKVEAEVGPIKYIAAFIYGVAPDATMLEKAVTWIIIMIVVVFDPLAIIMLLASQMTFGWLRGVKPEVEATTEATKPNVFSQFTEKFTEKIRRRFVKDDTPDFEGVKLPDGTWVQTGPAFNTAEPQEEYTSIDDVNRQLADAREDHSEGSLVVETEPDDEDYKPFKGTGVSPTGLVSTPYIQPKVEDEGEKQAKAFLKDEYYDLDEKTDPFMEDLVMAKKEPEPEPVVDTPNPRAAEASPGQGRGAMYSAPIQADNSPQLGKAANTGFGNDFPTNPQKGDVYLRTDYLPNRLYKFNDKKWIEVDKSSTDVYAYEEAYIRHLIEEIESNRYDADTLTEVEREQIAEYLRKNA